ncbi:MAG: sigma-70 family RNA polymerase sigma factor [Chloroflexota bacterium]|nr:sigma-70 family RNA polymerase sigma factor [Chloroflexota bacterium]
MSSHARTRGGVSSDVHLPPFATLVDAHAGELHRFLVRYVGPTEAEDCLQETFMSALRAYPSLRNADNLRAWLYTIAQRKALDTARRLARRPTRELAGIDPVAPPANEPSDDRLWMRVRALPEKQRAAVVHRFVLDLAYVDIGVRMGTTAEAARQNVSAGLRRLRREVTE